MPELRLKRDQLLALIRGLDRCAVAFSGGVDSAVVAKAAQLALGENALAVTGVSPSLAVGELEAACELAAIIGIRHEVIRTQEFTRPGYVENSPQRCYHCKTELYEQLEQIAERLNLSVLLNGANADDAGDYRPGMKAATQHRVRSPLLECSITKDEVRELAALWELPVWDKPASPCLASRVAYGEEVTPERVAMIDRAEQYLRGQGIRELRVRYHKGDLARIEVPPEELPRLTQPPLATDMVREFQKLGFKFVTLDLAGFRSGSLNALVPVEVLWVARP
jgi:pyridinium-3,5-biscarboxylic acid mononucleotide sulfurtransferase